MKQLLKEHEVKYIVRRRTKKEIGFLMRTFEITPHGGYAEIRMLGFFSGRDAARLLSKRFINRPTVVDAGFEDKDAVNLIWQSQIDQNL